MKIDLTPRDDIVTRIVIIIFLIYSSSFLASIDQNWFTLATLTVSLVSLFLLIVSTSASADFIPWRKKNEE